MPHKLYRLTLDINSKETPRKILEDGIKLSLSLADNYIQGRVEIISYNLQEVEIESHNGD